MKPFLLCLLLLTATIINAQSKIYTTDIPRYWKAYDSVQQVRDTILQQNIIQHLYLDSGSAGLQEFARIRHWTPARFRQSMINHRHFWASIRPRTEYLDREISAIKGLVGRYAKLYAGFKAPEICFVMGYIGTGGTTTQNRVLIGTEIAIADSSVDASGLNPFLQAYFRTNRGVVQLVAHELTHTQQAGGDMEDRRNTNLLGLCIAEGVCDFIGELLLERPVQTPYIAYGKAHEKELWEKFRQQMHSKDYTNWLYNGGSKKNGDADLGYFIGYAICRSYYAHAADKSRAIQDMIQVDYEHPERLDAFLARSGYNGTSH